MCQCWKTGILLLSLLLCIVPGANAEPVAAEIEVALPAGYSIFDGLWIAGTQENVFLLLGSEEENAMKLAVASQKAEELYRIDALSSKILDYDMHASEAGHMSDHWTDGHPYFWWGAGERKTDEEIYLQIEQDADLGWMVSYGFVKTDEVNYHFGYEEPGVLGICGETISPLILWPTNLTMTLEGFDLAEAERVSLEALAYLDVFKQNHEINDQDERYRIVW
ncbi:MAG: hypothetical protein IJ438_06945 [Clostridia bacterium]|nr:hypothetical protein [Clostridia bacterium]